MIIKSILDTDLYKFTTSYAYMKLFPQARGTFEFIDRDNTEYPEDFIERLYLELGSLGMLHLTKDEQEYMNNSCRFIPPVYWEWLSSFKFNSGKIQASLDENGHLHIKVTDYLYKVTLYEVPILAIVSELRSRIFDNNCDLAVVDESHIGISTNAIKGQLGGEENEVKAIMWVKMSDLDNYQWAFNHKHLIEGVFHTYVDYEEIEDLDNLFAE